MNKIVRRAVAGTLETSDAYVEVEPIASGVRIELESVVEAQFGSAILQSIREVIEEQDATGVKLRVVDRGALDCVIRARVETAIARGKEA